LAFLEAVVSGEAAIPMVSGIQMQIELKTVENKERGAWIPEERDVLRVLRITPPPLQLDLPLSPSDGGPKKRGASSHRKRKR
jgi:hypothetical protein